MGRPYEDGCQYIIVLLTFQDTLQKQIALQLSDDYEAKMLCLLTQKKMQVSGFP